MNNQENKQEWLTIQDTSYGCTSALYIKHVGCLVRYSSYFDSGISMVLVPGVKLVLVTASFYKLVKE